MPIDPSRTFLPVRIAVLTVSDTRTAENDTSGDLLVQRLEAAGHVLADRLILSDDADTIVGQFADWTDDPEVASIISTGGTGVTGGDVTPDASGALCERDMPKSAGLRVREKWVRLG